VRHEIHIEIVNLLESRPDPLWRTFALVGDVHSDEPDANVLVDLFAVHGCGDLRWHAQITRRLVARLEDFPGELDSKAPLASWVSAPDGRSTDLCVFANSDLTVDAVELVFAGVPHLVRVHHDFVIDEIAILVDQRAAERLLDIAQLNGAQLTNRGNVAEQAGLALVEVGGWVNGCKPRATGTAVFRVRERASSAAGLPQIAGAAPLGRKTSVLSVHNVQAGAPRKYPWRRQVCGHDRPSAS
jgi:hypothetical protein